MLQKVFLSLLALAIISMLIVTFVSYGWLQSIGDPTIAVANYQYFAGIGWTMLWISFIALLIVANVILYSGGKAWPMWISLAFFVTFLIIQTFWLEKLFYQ